MYEAKIFFLAALCVAMLSTSAATTGATLSVKIVDENGAPVAARVYVSDEGGKFYFAPGTVHYRKFNWNVSEEHFVASSGGFALNLPAGKYLLEIERGKEYLPLQEHLSIPAAGKLEKTFQLKRWISMSAMGWYSADMHPHISLRDVAPLMEGEDLNVMLPLSLWRVTFAPPYQDPLLAEHLAQSDASGAIHVGKARWFTPLNAELESDNSALLFSCLRREPLGLEFPFQPMAERAHRAAGLVDSEKATSLELPAIAALGGVDLVGLANNHFWRAGCYTGSWGAWPDHVLRRYPQTCAGFALAGFDLYYALLNLGFPIKLSAGSAYGVQPTPAGWSRIYVHVPGEFTPENWFRALQAGRSFVTTGPMMLLKVNGLEPGEEYRGSAFPLKVQIELRVLSPSPIHNAEIVVNGDAHPIALAPEPAAEHSFRGSAELVLNSSSWLAARCLPPRGKTIDVVHSSPIYFWKNDSPVPVPRAQAVYFLGRVEEMMREVKTGSLANGTDPTSIVLDTLAMQRLAMDYLERALAVYREKVRQSQ